MKKMISIIDRISFYGAIVAGILVCIICGMILVEIVLRSFLNTTMYIADEYAGYAMALISFLGLGYTLSQNGHIRMTFIHKALKEKGRGIIDLFAYLVGVLVSFYIVVVTWKYFFASAVDGSRSMQISQTPLAIPQFFVFLGSVMLALQFISETCKAYLIVKGDTEVEIKEGAEFI